MENQCVIHTFPLISFVFSAHSFTDIISSLALHFELFFSFLIIYFFPMAIIVVKYKLFQVNPALNGT